MANPIEAGIQAGRDARFLGRSFGESVRAGLEEAAESARFSQAKASNEGKSCL